MVDGSYLKDELYANALNDTKIFDFIQQGSLDGVWYWDLENPQYEWMSPRFWETLGFSADEKRHLTSEWSELVFEEDMDKLRENLNRHLSDPSQAFDQIVRYRHRDNSTVWIRCRGIAIRDEKGKPVRMLGAHTDLTAYKNMENENEANFNERTEFELILNSVNDGIYKVNADGAVTYINPTALKLLGFKKSELLYQNFYSIVGNPQNRILPTYFSNGMLPGMDILERKEKHAKSVFWTKSNAPIFVEYKKSPLYKGDQLDGTVIVFRDITQEEESNRKLDFLAHHDPLTELPNRAYCLDYLNTLITNDKNNEKPAALIFIDLDNFKEVNDLYGHSIGDHVLQTIARRIKGNIRPADFSARLGGDEFVVIIENVSNEKHICTVACALLDAISTPIQLEGQTTKTTCSVGIAMYPENGSTSTDLLRFADQAMYESKRWGKNQYYWFSNEISQRIRHENELKYGLTDALESEELYVEFQPIFGKNLNIKGFEALCRWKHNGVKVKPEVFIPIAEKNHFISRISEFVLEKALKFLQQLILSSEFNGYISINISLYQLRNDSFIRHVIERLRYFGIHTDKLVLEITESKLVENLSSYQHSLDLITKEQLTLALDDFGTGYASFRHLKLMPIKYIKIDRSFIGEVPRNTEATHTLASMLNLGHSLNLHTIVEGVESNEQMQWLEKFNCDRQGFYYSYPIDTSACQQLMT